MPAAIASRIRRISTSSRIFSVLILYFSIVCSCGQVLIARQRLHILRVHVPAARDEEAIAVAEAPVPPVAKPDRVRAPALRDSSVGLVRVAAGSPAGPDSARYTDDRLIIHFAPFSCT